MEGVESGGGRWRRDIRQGRILELELKHREYAHKIKMNPNTSTDIAEKRKPLVSMNAPTHHAERKPELLW